jgi:REP element-mobilizing transposase RayT
VVHLRKINRGKWDGVKYLTIISLRSVFLIMPRTPRLHIPGVVNHIMARGIEGRDIFNNDDDRHLFIRLLAAELNRAGHRCYAWVLMNNHYHLLLRTCEQPLGIMMRRLNSAYARQYGKKYNRRGYLFQDRFKSIATQDQRYVEEIIRYIHLNPIRAGVCQSMDDLDEYRWSGHTVLMGRKAEAFQDTRTVLLRFNDDIETARKRYRTFLSEGLNNSDESVIETIRKSNKGTSNIHSSSCWVIGDPEFVRNALLADTEHRIRIAKYQATGWTLEKLADCISSRMKVSKNKLQAKSKRTPEAAARKVFCYLGYRVLGMSATDIARFLGVSIPAVFKAMSNGEKLAKEGGIKIDG